ncbi:MAG: dienelactone hydrolase family protein [bacterium]
MKKLSIILVCFLVGFATACKEEKAQTPVTTEEAPTEIKVKGVEVIYATDSTNLKGYMAYNENSTEKRPGVLIIHEWWGHNDYVRERADMLAELGYTAFAVDMYGDGKQAAHPQDAGKFAGAVMSNMPEAEARFNAALELLRSHESVNADQTAAIGYCFGGSVALTMANSGADLDAVAAFHSGVSLPVMPNDQLKARVLVCNGGADGFISPESITAFKSAMDSINANYEYISYPGVKHSFTSKEADANAEKFGMDIAYDADADQQSWASLQALFNEVFE